MTPRVCSTPSSRRWPRRLPEAALAFALAASSCVRALPPSPDVVRRAAALDSYSADLHVSVRGALRGGSRVLVAFRRPDALRIEIPGPAGARLVAVTCEGRLTAVLPGERAVLERPAAPAEMEALVGIPLAPAELMDLLVGVAPKGVRRYQARWGRELPTRIDAELQDGTRVTARVSDADAGGGVAGAAFDPPPHQGYRPVDADEARRLLGGR